MSKAFSILILIALFTSCDKNDPSTEPLKNDEFVSAVDISAYPQISSANPTFYDSEGQEADFLDILKANGVNTVRLKLWVNPADEHSGYDEVKTFSETLKSRGFKTWLTLHYSDTWADPGHQETPVQWQGMNISELEDEVYSYTEKIVSEMKPEYIQIGNEINSGFLHPIGKISSNKENFKALIDAGIAATRANSSDTKIILHYAGTEGSGWFYNQLSSLDYDIIGLSYYPIWHGKSLGNLQNTMNTLSKTHEKQIIIAETAYPFTLSWNDWTNNIVGLNEQLISEYPASPEGQSKFIADVRDLMIDLENGLGFCYWGAELIAWRGDQASDGSVWENQALFDFNNKALPVLEEFKSE